PVLNLSPPRNRDDTVDRLSLVTAGVQASSRGAGSGPMTMRARYLLVALICFSISGCGDDDSDSGPPGTIWAPPDPSFEAARAACTFSTGAKVEETLGLSDAARASIPIRHVVILMKENRSFDHLFGPLHGQGQPGSEAIPDDFRNPTNTGRT